ncbi:bifunctional ADP-dependent NAD(P)H-hydrate dehydratase/NAD(P)H-hydrate epimerase, partial [Ruegeria sp. NA]|nr:bifunctional ADP-dependent NAD(P)H-hydrate dehydratase/NAD(P)H-hydrate epimerase [Ruegeria sp. NA]
HGRRCARSALTVSFHSRKLGHVLSEGPYFCGLVVTKDIGLRHDAGGVEISKAVDNLPAVCLGKSMNEHKY